jgi:hypothetical protein
MLMKVSVNGVFSLWKKDTRALARRFIQFGFRAVIASVDFEVLAKDFVGREYDERFCLTFLRMWIRAAKTVNFTRLFVTARFFISGCLSRKAKKC